MKTQQCLRVVLLIASLVGANLCRAQGPLVTVTGRILDPNSAAIVEAGIVARNVETGIEVKVQSNEQGIYYIANLDPGTYEFSVSKPGFAVIRKPDVILHVGDLVSMNFNMKVGAIAETITVTAGAPLLNTTDGSVSTVIDRNFVDNVPLNGRSFQGLILLTPGIVTTTPASGSSLGSSGEFSVNGQRTESNYSTVDGVSANTGIAPGVINGGASAGISGSVSSATALGTTQTLLSLDAMEEFKVLSSTYSAEYGRNPGGQFTFLTRSGTNQWHGNAFEYFRNNFFDANDWFNDQQGVPEPPLRQNDFGGTLGGPVSIPGLYSGKDKTFFFFSYEGLRLRQPQAATTTYVPNQYLRQCTPAALQPVLNAFPKAKTLSGTPDCTMPDPGDGMDTFVGSWSNPSSLDAYSIRFDHKPSANWKLFFRFATTPSSSVNRSTSLASQLNPTTITTRSYTGGITTLVSARISNDFRINYSSNEAALMQQLDNFGGATPANLATLQGIDTNANPDYSLFFGLFFSHPTVLSQSSTSSVQRQWNLVDTVSVASGSHELRFGVDYRRLSPVIRQSSPAPSYSYYAETSVTSNNADLAYVDSYAPAYPLYKNVSTFVSDEWRVGPRLNLSLGLRWEINPAPGVTQGLMPYTLEGTSNLATMTLAPQGTPLWPTKWYELAPRFGAAYALRNDTGSETVVRGGAGIFFDTAQQAGSYGFQGPGFNGQYTVNGPALFPVAALGAPPTIQNPPMAPYTNNNVFAFPNLELPYTIQTNLSVEQAFGKSQRLTASYVGAFGRKLLQQGYINAQPANNNFGFVNFFQNGLTSNYNALQMQYQRRMAAGLEALGTYTWSHCFDYGSSNIAYPYQRGNCDYDVRHNFSAALSYQIPFHSGLTIARVLLRNWGVDDHFTARTGFPLTIAGQCTFLPSNSQYQCLGVDVDRSQPIYLYGSTCAAAYGAPCPGGRGININAFAEPASGLFGNAPRNFVRGFGAWQNDLAVRRVFPLSETVQLQFRAEAFNLFNHPNFGAIDSFYFPGSTTFGLAQATLATSLGGLNPLYQLGGPRSMQFALKLSF